MLRSRVGRSSDPAENVRRESETAGAFQIPLRDPSRKDHWTWAYRYSKFYLSLTIRYNVTFISINVFLCYIHLYLFLSIFQSMSKLVHREWERHQKESHTTLPKLTATKARKVAVSTLRESGASRKEQEALARQMVHNVTTADRYYDKSLQSAARAKVLQKLRSHYKVFIVKKYYLS